MSRTCLVMSETSVPSSLASVIEALNTFIAFTLPCTSSGFHRHIACARRRGHLSPYGATQGKSIDPDGMQEVAETVAEEVETQHGQRDGGTGKECEPGAQGQEVLRLLEHEAPRRLRRLGAETEVREGGFREDGDRKARGRLHDEGRQA